MSHEAYFVRRDDMFPAEDMNADMAKIDGGWVKVRVDGDSDRHAEELSRVHSHIVVLSEQQEAILALVNTMARLMKGAKRRGPKA